MRGIQGGPSITTFRLHKEFDESQDSRDETLAFVCAHMFPEDVPAETGPWLFGASPRRNSSEYSEGYGISRLG